MRLWEALEASNTGKVYHTEKKREYATKGLNIFRWNEINADVWEPVNKKYVYKSLINILRKGAKVQGFPDWYAVSLASGIYKIEYNSAETEVEAPKMHDNDFLEMCCDEVEE